MAGKCAVKFAFARWREELLSAGTMQNSLGFTICHRGERTDMAAHHSMTGFARGRGRHGPPVRRSADLARHDQTTQAGRLCSLKNLCKNNF